MNSKIILFAFDKQRYRNPDFKFDYRKLLSTAHKLSLVQKKRYELMKCQEQDDCLSMKILIALFILLTLFVESLSFVVVPRFFQQKIARLTMTADTIMDCLEAQVRITNILIYLRHSNSKPPVMK